jgi:hypothetical protein
MAHSFYPGTCAPSMPSGDAGHWRPVSFLCNVPAADTLHGSPTPAGTAAAHNVKTMKPRFGWIGNKPSYYRLRIFW